MAEIENFYSDLYASSDEEEVADPMHFFSDTRNSETNIRLEKYLWRKVDFNPLKTGNLQARMV